jgi:hypothetical protein
MKFKESPSGIQIQGLLMTARGGFHKISDSGIFGKKEVIAAQPLREGVYWSELSDYFVSKFGKV